MVSQELMKFCICLISDSSGLVRFVAARIALMSGGLVGRRERELNFD